MQKSMASMGSVKNILLFWDIWDKEMWYKSQFISILNLLKIVIC